MTSLPVVSILLPTYNAARFLSVRLDSILAQRFRDWELIAVDSDSTDGTRETLDALARRDARVRVHSHPRGLYGAWNAALAMATGEYVYIATADDWMRDDALARMTAALDRHPDCDLCDTRLVLIDEAGREIGPDDPAFLPHYGHVDFPRDRAHVRRAPEDFYPHMGGKTVYTSVAQLLIRRKLFDRTGPFPTEYGPSGDYLWGMRAALAANVVYIPEPLTAWRVHGGQATFGATPDTVDANFRQMEHMATLALTEVSDPEVLRRARRIAALVPFKTKLLPAKRKRTAWRTWLCALKAAARHPCLAWEFFRTAMRLRNQGPRPTWLIRAYDAMILRRVRRVEKSCAADVPAP